MKTFAVLGTLAAALAAGSVAVAQEPRAPAQPSAPTGASTTTVTSSPAPAMSLAPRQVEKDTVTLYQSVRPNKAFLYTGGGLLLGGYVPMAALTAANPDSDRTDKSLYLPVVGPWLHLADRDCRSCSDGANTLDTVLVAGSGVVQGAGILLMAASLLVPEKVPAATIQAGNVKMTLTAASVGRGAATFGAVGTF